MSERDMVRRPAPPEYICDLPYGPVRQLAKAPGQRVQYADPPLVVANSWTDPLGYRLGMWHDGQMFRYMERLW